MEKTKLTPRTVSFKGLKVDFGHDDLGCMGTMYLGKRKIAKFFDDGRGGEWDIQVFDSELEQEALDYLSTVYEEEYLHSLEIFIDLGISDFLYMKEIQSFAKKNINKYVKDNNLSNNLSTGAFVFSNGETLTLNILSDVVETLSESDVEKVYLPIIKKNKNFYDAKEVFFIKFISARKIIFLKIK